jgi:large subunit ribosomal protein L15
MLEMEAVVDGHPEKGTRILVSKKLHLKLEATTTTTLLYHFTCFTIRAHTHTMSLSSPLRPLTRHICRQCRITLARQSTAQASTSTTSTSSPPPTSSTTPISLHNAAGTSTYAPDNAQSLPRWARTPAAMKAPYRIRPKTDQDAIIINSDPAVLDSFYTRFLGPGGAETLPEDIKWLAVTHKSFDQGRRGFNERLVFFGRKIVELQTSLALLDTPKRKGWMERAGMEDKFGRKPFVHSATVACTEVRWEEQVKALEKKRMAQLCESYGGREVIRWQPKQVRLKS